ncbi:hypothetical protein NW755_007780 [Fusarium falciforme]|uniref:C2H2-type domain-containing protein n=1 Tax=Fusarium falciforme TaxID=195108 RepID=A0A9W8R536_9HYPO|nr:hypothetical protein NW755_007780 [Fusarium falciforme]
MVSSSPSVVSASRTIASGKHQVLAYPPAPGFAAKRRYEKLKSQRMIEAAEKSTEPSLQELLESDLRAIGEITCPYCLYALPAAEVFDERKWQNHVKNDLDPYVCLFEDCDQPDVLYTHSDEWLGHLHQHGKVWRCSSHREMGPFSTLEDYMKHMREVHDTKLSDRQLRVVANRNSRKTTKLFPSCPLCGREESEVDGRLEDHLAGHLRSLALKSLPSYQDEIPDDAGDENNSIDGSQPRSRSTLREMEEEKEEMLREGAGNFWDHWTPQLAQGISVNFLGEFYFELDLGDSEAQVASLFFDTMVFKEPSENLDDDPILQSMLQQQLARIEVIDAGTDDSSDLSVEHGVTISSRLPMDETSGQAEVDGALIQQPVDAEAAHVQAVTPGQDTEVDSPGEGEIPETLIEPTTKAPPVTKLDIPVDTENANLSNVTIDKTSKQDEVGEAATQRPTNAETVHAQTATVGKDDEVILPKKDEDPKPNPTAQSHPVGEPDISADLEKVDLSTSFGDETSGQEKVDTTAGPEFANTEAVDLKQSKSIHDIAYFSGAEPKTIEEHDPSQINAAVSLINKIKDRFRDKQEAYEKFIAILQDFQAFWGYQTPPSDDVLLLASVTYRGVPGAHWRTLQRYLDEVIPLFKSAPDLLEELLLPIPNSIIQLKQDARPNNQDLTRQNFLIYGRSHHEDMGRAFNHDPDKGNTVSKTQTTHPPKGSTSLEEKDDPPDSVRKRESGVYINGEKVMDLDRRDRPLIKRQSPSPSPGKAQGGSSSSQIPPRPGSTIDNQGSAASAPQARYASVPVAFRQPVSDGDYHPYPIAESEPLDGIYHPYPIAESEPLDGIYHPYPIPQSDPFKPPPPPPYLYPDDAFEADVEDDIPRPKNPRQKTRNSGIYVDGKKVRDLNRGNSPVGSRRERIVIVDNPPTPYTTPNTLPYATTGHRPVIVDERPRPRPRVEIEIVDDSRPRRHRHTSDVASNTRSLKEESTHPRHVSDVPRSALSLNDDYEEREKRRQRRREKRRQQEEADERLRARINKANAEISGRPPVPQPPPPYRRLPVELLDSEPNLVRTVRWDDLEQERRNEETLRRAPKEEGKEMEPSARGFNEEAELVETVRRLKAEQERYEEEIRRLSQKEDRKGKEKEGEGKQPAVELPNREAELIEAVRRLEKWERREEKDRRRARKEELEEDEIQRRRLIERMKPREGSSVGPGSRRHRVLYDEGIYRWE